MEKSHSTKSKAIENCLDYYELRIKRSLRDPKFALEIAGFVVLTIYAGFTIAMYFANRDAANAAKKASDVAEQTLIITERPWIKVEGVVATSPLIFLPNGRASINLSFHLRNIGHSIATGIYLRPQMMGNTFDNRVFSDPFTKQAEWCENVKKETPNPRMLKTLFPDEDTWEPMGLELTREEIESSSATYPSKESLGKFITPLVYGCLNYQFSFSKDIHQTRFIFSISHPFPKDKSIPIPISIGKDVPTSDLVIENYFFGGTFAD
jgi:hypothetical protein